MDIYIDIADRRIVTSPVYKAGVESLAFKRGDNCNINLQFVSDLAALSATNDKQITFGIKKAGIYGDGGFIVYATDYTTSGSSYILNPSFNTVELNSLLNAVDGLSGNDIASVTCNLEIEWIVDDVVTSTNIIPVTIYNDLISGNEGTALSINPSPLEWMGTLALVLSAAPEDAASSGNMLITGATGASSGANCEMIAISSNVWTSTGETYPLLDPWGKTVMYYDAGVWRVKYNDLDEQEYPWESDDDALASPDLVSAWFETGLATGALSVTAISNEGTPADYLGQDAIVNEADVYKCVRVEPVKWIQLN